MPGFLDLLRGGLDTAGRVQAAKSQADEQDAAQSVNFLMRLQALRSQEAQRASEEDYRRAMAARALRPPPPRRTTKVNEDGSVSIINLDDPNDVQKVKGVTVPTRADPQRPRITTSKGIFFVNPDGSLEPATYGGEQVQPPVGRGASGEPPEVTATRKDLKDIQGQQIRAENQAKALKSEQRAYGTAHPRAAKGLPLAKTAADTAAVNEFTGMGAGIDSAEARAARLTRSADSTLNVLHQKRNATPSVSFNDVQGGGSTGGVADPDTFTDAEIQAGHAAGITTPDDMITFVTKLRAKPKR